jgi:hypothetical protein
MRIWVLLIVCALAAASGCASTLRFSIVGDANEVGAVDERYGASTVEARMIGVGAELAPGAAEDATRRLSSMLPASDDAIEAPPTRLEVTYFAADKAALKVKVTTSVHGHDVVTEEESPDLAEGRGLYLGSSIYTYIAVGVGSVFTTIAGGALALNALPCALVSLVVAGGCLVAAVPGLIVQSVALSSMEKSIEARGAQFIGDVLRKHAQRIGRRGAREERDDDDDLPASAPASAPPASAPRAPAAPPSAPAVAEDAVWYVGVDGQPRGPMTASDVRALQRKGTINYDTLVWKDGMQWTPLRDVKELWSPDIPPPLPRAKGAK